eukprot:378540_1
MQSHILQALREKYNSTFRHEFCVLKETKKFKKWQDELELDAYDFVVPTPEDFERVLELVSKGNYYKNSLCQLFDYNQPTVRAAFRKRCEFACNNSRMICATNKNTKEFVAGIFVGDLCDHTDYSMECEDTMPEVGELEAQLENNINFDNVPEAVCKIFANDIANDNELKALYGTCFGGLTAVVLPGHNNFLFAFLTLVQTVITTKLGYRMMWSQPAHVSTERMLLLYPDVKKISEITMNNLLRFRFKNGKDMKHYLDVYAAKNGTKAMLSLKNKMTMSILVGTKRFDVTQIDGLIKLMKAQKIRSKI